MFKAIFFDVDGTIIPLKVVVKNFQETCKHFKIRVLSEREILDKGIGYRISEVMPELIPEAKFFEKEFIKYFEDNQIRNFKKYGKLLPHVRSVFKKIKNKKMKLGIITTKKRREALAILNGYGLHCDIVIGNDDVKNRKPDPEPVFKACKKLKVEPKECIFVGDSPFDMKAAKSAGCMAIGVLTGWGKRKNLKKAGADYIIKDLGDLNKFLR